MKHCEVGKMEVESLKELVGKKVIIEIYGGIVYSGLLDSYESSSKEKIKLKHAYIVVHTDKSLLGNELEEIELPVEKIIAYEKVIPWLNPYFPSR
jgi:small nuclear ribonucleoprotein (snRNP)-like protein